jgi:histidine ammonia-lyase
MPTRFAVFHRCTARRSTRCASHAESSRRELNAATDNPLVLATGELLSGGNFHGQAVGMVSDMLAIITANLAVISERRIDRLVHPDFNQGLPPFLAPPGTRIGI